jgi:hypothetical protein
MKRELNFRGRRVLAEGGEFKRLLFFPRAKKS